MDPPPKGRSLTVPTLTSLPTSDRHWFLAGGAPVQMASSLRTGDHSALKDPTVPRGLLRRAGRPGVLLPVEVGPGFPWGSLAFLFVALPASVAIAGRWDAAVGCGIPAGHP